MFKITIEELKEENRKSAKRRLQKQTRYYAELLRLNERKFYAEWHRRVDGWLSEIRFRVKNWRGTAENHKSIGEMLEINEPVGIFDMFETAKNFIAAQDEKVRRRVENPTLKLLEVECVKAVAAAFNLPQVNSSLKKRLHQRLKG